MVNVTTTIATRIQYFGETGKKNNKNSNQLAKQNSFNETIIQFASSEKR